MLSGSGILRAASILAITSLLGTSSVMANCVDLYLQRYDTLRLSFSFKTNLCEPRAWGHMAKKSFKYPAELMGDLNYATSQEHGAYKVPLGIATFTAPVLVAPFTTTCAVGSLVLGAPVAAIGKRINKVRTTVGTKEAKKDWELMSALETYKITNEKNEVLDKFLKKSEVQYQYHSDQAALDDLLQAYSKNYFCPSKVRLMSRKEILSRIKNGDLKRDLIDNSGQD